MKNQLLAETLAEALFWLHTPIVIIWFGLFLVPLSLWQNRAEFHFFYIAGIMAVQYLWSIAVFRKNDIICPLTTLMQSLRGYSLNDKKNYGHSFIAEFLNRFKINISYKLVNMVLLITLIITAVQYFMMI